MIKTNFFIRKQYLFFIRLSSSLFWTLKIMLRNNKKNISEKLIKKYGKESTNVHIICPGPSIKSILESNLDKNHIYIFVNHAVAYASKKEFKDLNKIFFSADPVRANEIISQRILEFEMCESVLFPGHLFHMNLNVFNKFNNIYLPKKLSIDYEFGLVGKSSDPRNIKMPINTFTGYGFGSLAASVSLALLFNPQIINFWGCDFGDKNGRSYGVDNVPQLGWATPHDKIRKIIDTFDQSLKDIKFIYNS